MYTQHKPNNSQRRKQCKPTAPFDSVEQMLVSRAGFISCFCQENEEAVLNEEALLN